MSTVWRLPKLEEVRNIGTAWLLHVLQPLSEIERCMLMLTLWRVWHNRNEATHYKKPPPLEVSKSFLVSYLDSLLTLTYSEEERMKGKHVIPYDHVKLPRVRAEPVANALWTVPVEGWAKLNTDGSWAADGGAGAGMVLRDSTGQIIFTSCRVLFSCRNALEA